MLDGIMDRLLLLLIPCPYKSGLGQQGQGHPNPNDPIDGMDSDGSDGLGWAGVNGMAYIIFHANWI